MKIAAICAAALVLAGANAQGAGEAMDCLEKPSHDIGPPPPLRPAAPPAAAVTPAADNWIVSETTSPIDYTPVAIATASSGAGPDGAGPAGRIQRLCRSALFRCASRSGHSPKLALAPVAGWRAL